MRSRPFQASTFAASSPVSEIGLGCWQLGANWGDAPTEVQAFEIMGKALACGVTIFDTANVYGDGRSERLIGEFLSQHKVDVFTATKLGRDAKLWPDHYDAETVRDVAEASRERLRVDRIDLLQLHCPPTEVLRDGRVFDRMRELQSGGIIARWGVSVESMAEALICLDQPDCASLQIIFNLFRQKPIASIFTRALETQTALIVRLPLASGLLAGKFTAETTFAENDHRHFNRDGQCFNVGETFAGLPFAMGVELVDALKEEVPEDWTLADLAQRWILDFPAVTTVITGASQPEQVAQNSRVSELPGLSQALHEKLSRFYATEVAAHIRGPY